MVFSGGSRELHAAGLAGLQARLSHIGLPGFESCPGSRVLLLLLKYQPLFPNSSVYRHCQRWSSAEVAAHVCRLQTPLTEETLGAKKWLASSIYGFTP